jgi:acetamidase/formamidase
MSGWKSLATSTIALERQGLDPSAPRAETKTHYIAIGLDPDLDNAMQMAYDQTVEWLAELKGMDPLMITPLASIGIDYRITKIVDGTKGVHAMIPKSYFIDAKDTYWSKR